MHNNRDAHLMVEVMAWDNPKYVLYKKENWNLSFWQIETNVPVVFKPLLGGNVNFTMNNSKQILTYISEEEKRKEIDKRVRQFLVLC